MTGAVRVVLKTLPVMSPLLSTLPAARETLSIAKVLPLAVRWPPAATWIAALSLLTVPLRVKVELVTAIVPPLLTAIP